MTTAGGIEEDLIKCLGPVYVGDFSLPGKDLFKKGIDRSENISDCCGTRDTHSFTTVYHC